MASNNRKLKGKRYLRMNDGPNDNDQQNVQNALDGHTTATFFDNNINRRIKSRRWIEVSEAVVEDSRVKQHNDDGINVIQHRDKRVRNNRETSNVTMKRTTVTEANSNGNGQGGTGEHLHSFGQASYQSTRQGSIIRYEDAGDNIYVCDYCDALFWLEEAIKQTSTKVSPIYTNCCKKGKIKLPHAKPTPNFLRTLLDPNNGSESKLFRENIRIYNSMFSFTSMGAIIDRKINTGLGPYVFKISGQVHHLMGFILPSEGEFPKYAQLYIYDTQNEIYNRINAIDPTHMNNNIKPYIVEGLIKMFDEINELVKQFRTIRDKFENQCLPLFTVNVLDCLRTDSKQYERPTSEEISGLIVGDIGEHNSERDIIIESNNRQLQRVSKIHPKYMSLQYPILFSYGEDGYKPNLLMHKTSTNSQQKRERISMRSYITYQIQDRRNVENTLLQGGRLFQQFLVDAYATVEEDRLDWIRKNQKNFRNEILKEMYTASSSGIHKGHDLGQKIILPSSHTGSPRDMINNYQDAMAICRQYGNPDLFITFTCNVKWIEIQRYFKNDPKSKIEDRPDIISRIFNIKLQNMITYIKSGEPFGQVEADVCTIEFQKRGLHERWKML